MQAWQEEVERARQSQREAENKISSLEVPVTIFKYAVISKIKIGYVCAWQHGKFILTLFLKLAGWVAKNACRNGWDEKRCWALLKTSNLFEKIV